MHNGIQLNRSHKPMASPYALTLGEEKLVVEYALEHPEYYHRQMAYRMMDEDIVYTSPSTVYRILRKHGLIRKNVYKKRYGWAHPYSNEAKGPDELWQADITYLQYKQKDVYMLSFIDVYSRFVVFAKLLMNIESGTVSRVFQQFIEGAKERLYQMPRLQTDNASYFKGSEFRSVVQRHMKDHTTIHPSTPTENVIIERWHRTFKELLYDKQEPSDFEELAESIQQVCDYYNYNCVQSVAGICSTI
ncbi:MAG: transposase [Spirochaetales bacterium]|nr:transposase [Spirochaetales bacterium]